MAEHIKTEAQLLKEAQTAFSALFNKKANIGASAPGRVNLIGEHTDYNDGYVFPMALPLCTVIVGTKNDSDLCCVKTLAVTADLPHEVEFKVLSESTPFVSSQPFWSNYIKGTIANFPETVPGFDAVIVSSVPLGGGLSSSASLEVAIYTFLEVLTNFEVTDLRRKALACQKAEHEYASMPCGIMDQFVSTMGQKNNGLLIDCRSLEVTPVYIENSSVSFVIINSNVRHALTGSEYPHRRKNCHKAAEIMNKKSLRDATLAELLECKSLLSSEIFCQAKHVITENKRTVDAVEKIKTGDFVAFGKLMSESHESLKNDFKVSCPELDKLVELALEVPGVYGSRMTGGGFGGCTVTMVDSDKVDALIINVKEKYSGYPIFYVCQPWSAAHKCNL